MKRKRLILAAAVLLFAAAGFGGKIMAEAGEQTEENKTEDGSAAASAAREKSDLEIYRNMLGDSTGNFVMSPYSINDAFHLLYPSASGETKDSMDRVFGFGTSGFNYGAYDKAVGLNAENMGFQSANRVFINQNGADQYHTELIPDASFDRVKMGDEAQNRINAFVKQETNGMIESLPCDTNESTAMVLLNALYFHEKWESDYEKDSTGMTWSDGTKRDSFGDSVGLTDFKEPNGQIDVLRLPYRKISDDSHQFSFIVFADSTGSDQQAVRDYVAGLSSEEFEKLVDFTGNPAQDYDEAYFRIPEFTISNEGDITEPLKAAGLADVFSENADFSRLGPVSVSRVLQAAKIKVDHTGTEAAAATSIVMTLTSLDPAPKKIKNIVADSYFVYVLRDETAGVNLFIGCTADPQV